MRRYVYIEDGQVVEGPRLLPQSWRNISGFEFLEEEQLRSYGWYPYVFVEYEGDLEGKVPDASDFLLTDEEYIELQRFRDKTDQEHYQEVQSRWEAIRARRNILLTESDWTQLVDVSFDPETESAWKDYRRKLRNITDAPNPDSVVWPDPPPFSPVI